MKKNSAFLAARAAWSAVVLTATVVLGFYPAVITGIVLCDTQLRREGQSKLVPGWFNGLSVRYEKWAGHYLESGRAQKSKSVAATEWPMFGSVFFLLTAEALQEQGLVDARSGQIRRAVERAREIVVSPDTATWVKQMWGEDYLERENVFYRMLLILGTSAYESITGDLQCRALMSEQRQKLAAELERAPRHLLDDYPGECWPVDIAMALTAIQRAAALEGTNHNALTRSALEEFSAPLGIGFYGLPPYKVAKTTGTPLEVPRGAGLSGCLTILAEADLEMAERWHRAYTEQFWKQNAWLAGFSEYPSWDKSSLSDVDSGPVVFGVGSVASAFGIGASRMVGRFDQAAPLTMEAVACAWPTPFGFLLPMLMGKVAMDGACLAETALLFSMTRPNRAAETTPFTGRAPLLVWIMMLAYAGWGVWRVCGEIRWWRRWRLTHKD